MNIILGTFGSEKAKRRAKRIPGNVYMDLPTGCIARYNSYIYIGQAWIKRRLLLLLFTCRYAQYDTIMEVLWGDDEDGGPESSRTIAIHLYRLNPALDLLGLKIITRRGQGLELIDNHEHTYLRWYSHTR